MSTYLQVYTVLVDIKTDNQIYKEDIFTIGFPNDSNAFKVTLNAGIRLGLQDSFQSNEIEVCRLYSLTSIQQSGTPNVDDEFYIYDTQSKQQIGWGKLMKIIVQE